MRRLSSMARLLSLPAFWNVSPHGCVDVALFVSSLVYACVDRGQLFAYFGWVHPRRRIFSLYALIAGAAAAALVIAIVHVEQTPLGHTSPSTLLYGVTIGPIIEEIRCIQFRNERTTMEPRNATSPVSID